MPSKSSFWRISAQFAKPANAAAIQFKKALVRIKRGPLSYASCFAIKVREIRAIPTEVTTAAE